MIRYALPEEKEAIIELFNICFPGEEKFAEWFFENIYDNNNTLVYECDGRLAAALQMLPVILCDGENTYRSSYLYGVGTLPEYRGKGIMTHVINYSFDLGKKNGIDYSVLIVQEQSLLEYYKRFGFKKFFSVGEKTIKADNALIDFRNLKKSDMDDLNKLYELSCEGKLYALRDKKHYASLFDMYWKTSFVYEKNGTIDSYVMGYFTDNAYVASECIGQNAFALAASVAAAHSKPEVKCIFPGNDKFIGMIKPINSSEKNIEGYINLLYN